MDLYLRDKFLSINNQMTELEFYKFLLPVTARIGNGHSRIMPSDAYLHYSRNNIKKFPFKLVIHNQHAYIVNNYCSNSSIVKGTEILSINRTPFHIISSQIAPLLPADGYSLAFKHAKLAFDFDLHYSMFYDYQDSFSLELLPPGKKHTSTITVEALLEKDIDENIDSDNTDKYFDLEYTEDSIGILTIRNFWYKTFKCFIDSAFKDLSDHNVKNLIIDLRDNRGGNDDNGVYLYSYLSDRYFHYYSLMETHLEQNQKTIPCIEFVKKPENITQIVKLITKDEKDRNVILNPDTTIGFVKPGIMHKPKQSYFKGNVYILINGLSFSVTSDFCSIAHKNGRAKFIGSETGGCYYGNTSGYSFHLILPNSKLDIRLNLIEYLTAVENSTYPYGRGVLPDFEIYPSALDIYNGVDTEKEYALNLIRKIK